MNGGLVSNKSSFLQILKQVNHLDGKMVLQESKENTIVELELEMLLEEKFLMHI